MPVAYISAESAATGAVSQRKMRGPIEQMCSFIMRASSASNGSKPPSGPVRMAAEVMLPALSTASRSVSRSPVSYIKRGSAVAFALLKASARSGRNPTVGITPRPDCLAASSAMRCQRAIFLSASP